MWGYIRRVLHNRHGFIRLVDVSIARFGIQTRLLRSTVTPTSSSIIPLSATDWSISGTAVVQPPTLLVPALTGGHGSGCPCAGIQEAPNVCWVYESPVVEMVA